jgi:hypothetical protein
MRIKPQFPFDYPSSDTQERNKSASWAQRLAHALSQPSAFRSPFKTEARSRNGSALSALRQGVIGTETHNTGKDEWVSGMLHRANRIGTPEDESA